MSLFLILLAAGDSKRLKLSTPKPFYKVNNKTILEHSLNIFQDFQTIKKIVIVCNKKHKKYLNKIKLKNTIKVIGGKTRQQSTFKALKVIKKMNCKKVLIHDAARPSPSKNLINKVISKLKNRDVVIPIVKITDATKRINKNIIFKNIKRNNLRLAQTPQGFTFNKIFSKHLKNTNKSFDDDSALFTEDKENVFTVTGSKKNLKITDNEDLEIFKSQKKMIIRYGIGFDIHKFSKGRKLYLCGIKIPFKFGLAGHSDADPVLHALIDSLLGACGLKDIGKHFPDKDSNYKNIRSTELLKKTVEMINSKNFLINNIDINIITEKPKIKKYRKKMLIFLCKYCKINSNKINIKGKTTEKLGLIGKEKAVASEVISSVIKYV
jgi:2-C-methyl-D-erythritol 4-phosphate cytidylyltransferase / 2-C-methyl-D-erythritol 2,4-cyclodiphosphate synthase